MKWWGSDGSPAGRSVTPDQATHLTPVLAAIRHIVDFASTLPVDAYRRMDDGSRVRMPSLPQLVRVENEPGHAGAGVWFGQAVYGLVTVGNAVGWVADTDGFGYPKRVKWLTPGDWSYEETRSQWYVLGQPVARADVFHVPWIVPTGKTLGLSPLGHAIAMIRAGLSAQDYADIQRTTPLPPATLRNTALDTIDRDVSRAISDRAHEQFSTGRPFVTGKDWELEAIALPPNHVQFLETMKWSANQIAAVYGIDAREIGGDPGSSLTYFTDESRPLNRATNVRPYIVRVEDVIERHLPERQFIRLNVDAAIRTDIRTRTEVIGAQLEDGRLNLNEARALEDRPPVQGGDFHNGPQPQPAAPTSRKETPQ